MKLSEIQKPYHLFVSIGSACNPAIHLRRYNLRKFSMPLDWCVSLSISSIHKLFEAKLSGLMDFKNMELVENHTSAWLEDGPPPDVIEDLIKSYFLLDKHYDIYSVHDFPINGDQPWHDTYPDFKKKLERRTQLLLENLAIAPSVLFIRWSGEIEEVQALHPLLSEMTGGKADLLLLKTIEGDESVPIKDMEIEEDGICVVQVPNRPNDSTIWDQVMKGMSLLP